MQGNAATRKNSHLHRMCHMDCLENPPFTLTPVVNFECPNCVGRVLGGAPLVAKIREIEADTSMTEEEKARKRQEILSRKQLQINENEKKEEEKDALVVLGESIKCLFCYMLPDRIVTTSCGHNFCLRCFKKWIGQGKEMCVNCRSQISRQMINQPRINSALVTAIRMAKESSKYNAPRTPQAAYPQVNQKNRLDNPSDHFGHQAANASSWRKNQILCGDVRICTSNLKEYRKLPGIPRQGVLVGESWTHRLNCRQWGVHWPHVAGIAGQVNYGAQSVVLSGGYEDDEDHGEWFL